VFEKYLYGILSEVDYDDFRELTENQFPSLYWHKKKYILSGPLSLVNHQCGSSLHFSRPKEQTTVTITAKVYAQVWGGGDDDDVDGLDGMKDDEICVDYFPDESLYKDVFFSGKPCQCVACQTQPQQQQQIVK